MQKLYTRYKPFISITVYAIMVKQLWVFFIIWYTFNGFVRQVEQALSSFRDVFLEFLHFLESLRIGLPNRKDSKTESCSYWCRHEWQINHVAMQLICCSNYLTHSLLINPSLIWSLQVLLWRGEGISRSPWCSRSRSRIVKHFGFSSVTADLWII